MEFFDQLLGALGAPRSSGVGRRDQLGRRETALRLLREVGARVLVLDEINSVLAGTPRQQRLFLQLLLFLSNELRLPLVCAGVPEARHALLSDPQLRGRFAERELPPWVADAELRGFVRRLVWSLPLREPSPVDGARVLRLLAERLGGVTLAICRAVERAAVAAIRSGRGRIDLEALEDAAVWEDLAPPPWRPGRAAAVAGRPTWTSRPMSHAPAARLHGAAVRALDLRARFPHVQPEWVRWLDPPPWCPACLEDDLARHGEVQVRAERLLLFAVACPRHRLPLASSAGECLACSSPLRPVAAEGRLRLACSACRALPDPGPRRHGGEPAVSEGAVDAGLALQAEVVRALTGRWRDEQRGLTGSRVLAALADLLLAETCSRNPAAWWRLGRRWVDLPAQEALPLARQAASTLTGMGDGTARVTAAAGAMAALDALAPRTRGSSKVSAQPGDVEITLLFLTLPAADWRLLPEMARRWDRAFYAAVLRAMERVAAITATCLRQVAAVQA